MMRRTSCGRSSSVVESRLATSTSSVAARCSIAGLVGRFFTRSRPAVRAIASVFERATSGRSGRSAGAMDAIRRAATARWL